MRPMNAEQTKLQLRNRLGEETSLYLQQHADNPVAWQPWDEDALAAARESGRPILLSIGYSACHWCHVMAHESFEDEATAKVMNDLYVSIKVDREERPDLDKIYQLSHQLLTGRGGGWPLTLFLEPEGHTPFFAGTYFPLEARYGMPSFRDVLVRARQWYGRNPAEVKSQGERLQEAIESLQNAPAAKAQEAIAAAAEDVDPALIEQASKDVLARFDQRHGGYGGAPKFPQAPLLELVAELARSAVTENSAAVKESLLVTLENMAASGLRDHLDGGFFRYCVDASWTIPHFEKMLYDNAQLLPLYAEAATRSGSASLSRAAEGIVAWMRGEMRQANGGFSASIDADAGGEEGGFHVWDRDEVRELLDDDAFEAFAAAYGLDQPPNFEDRAWHLVGAVESDADAEPLKKARAVLRGEREKRVQPTLDRKQLTSWNALAAGGLLRAARALGRDDWIPLAQTTLDFIRSKLWDGSRLLAVRNQGESRFYGYLDDYAFTLEALLQSLRTVWRRDDLDFAVHIADALLLRFEDADHGGFFFSDADQPTPIARSIIVQDDATPAAYAVAIGGLQAMAALLGEQRYHQAAERALARARPGIERSPMACASATRAVMRARSPLPQVVISGRDRQAAQALKDWADSRYRADCYQIRAARDEAASRPLPGILAEFESDEPATAWVCLGMKCLPPVNSREELDEILKV